MSDPAPTTAEMPDLSYLGSTYAELCSEISDEYMGETGDLVREHAKAVIVIRQMRAVMNGGVDRG